MQSTIQTEKLSRSQRELASLVGPDSSAGGLGSNVPSVMGSSIWDDLADSARVNIEDLQLSDEMMQALAGQENVVRQLLLAVHSAGRDSIAKSVGLLRGDVEEEQSGLQKQCQASSTRLRRRWTR